MTGGSSKLGDLELSVRMAKMVLHGGGVAPDLVSTAAGDVATTALAVARSGSQSEVVGVLQGSRSSPGETGADAWNAIVEASLYALATAGLEAGPDVTALVAADRSAIAVRALTSADGCAYGRTTLEADDDALERLSLGLHRCGDAGDLVAVLGKMWLGAAGRSGAPPVAIVGAPEPWWTAPGPFEWKLPVTLEPCPVPAFEAWWSALVIRPDAPSSPLVQLAGDGTTLSTPSDEADSWGTGSVSQLRALMEVRPEEIRFVFTTLLPGGEGAAPTPTDLGFRLALAAIDAIELRMSFPTTRPLLGPVKKLVDSRGYQACSGYRLSIECSDGFATRKAVLSGGHLPVDREGEPKAAFDHAVAAIAGDRFAQPWVTDADRAVLSQGFGTTMPPAEERRGTGTNAYLHQTWRWQPPASRPLGARA